MSRKDDVQVLVHTPKASKSISQKTLIACLIGGIAILSLLIYLFIIALDLKSSHGLDPSEPEGNYASSKSCPQVEFDYLLLAVRWPPSDCTEDQCVPHIPSRWVIHGLWPNYANGSWPQFCCPSTPFEEEAVAPLQSRLLNVWPNLLKHENSSSLWAHEWNKHGTCSTKNPKVRGELNYFNHTLSLFQKIDVGKWLSSGEIVPGPKVVHKSDIKRLLSSRFGKKVSIQCVSEGIHHSTTPAPETSSTTTLGEIEDKKHRNLESIHFCYDKTDISAIDCPDHDNCPEAFVLPSNV